MVAFVFHKIRGLSRRPDMLFSCIHRFLWVSTRKYFMFKCFTVSHTKHCCGAFIHTLSARSVVGPVGGYNHTDQS